MLVTLEGEVRRACPVQTEARWRMPETWMPLLCFLGLMAAFKVFSYGLMLMISLAPWMSLCIRTKGILSPTLVNKISHWTQMPTKRKLQDFCLSKNCVVTSEGASPEASVQVGVRVRG